MTAPLLSIENLSIGFTGLNDQPVFIVRDVNLTLAAGETLGLVGESGCGKSSLLLAMMGYYKQGLGRLRGGIAYDGQDPALVSPQQLQALRGGGMALIPQNAGQALTPTLRIKAQMVEVLRLHSDLAPGAWQARCLALFERVKLPDPEQMLNRYPHELSGGQQQRVAIAMALAGEPDLLLLDEPTTGLDVTTQVGVLALLQEICQDLNTTMVYVSHDIQVISQVCNQIAIMYAGEIVEMGPRADLLTQPVHPYTQGLLASIPRLNQQTLPHPITGEMLQPVHRGSNVGCGYAGRCPLATDQCRATAPLAQPIADRWVKCHEVTAAMAGEFIRPAQKLLASNLGDRELLSVADLSIRYQAPTWLQSLRGQQPPAIVRAVSFGIQKGEIVGLVGESGSGKSTILKTIAGLQGSLSGRITLSGTDDLTGPVESRPRGSLRKVQLVFQNPDASLNPRKTIGEILRRPLELYFDLATGVMDQEVDALLQRVNLPESYKGRFPGQLSGGEKQRVAIARALAAKPELILCDEITSALDVSVQAAILKLLLDLRADSGVSLLFVSHDLAVVETLCDSVLVLEGGEVREAGLCAEVFKNPQHAYTQALLASVL